MARWRRKQRPSRLYWVLVGLLVFIGLIAILVQVAISALGPFTLPVFLAAALGAIYLWMRYRKRGRFRVKAFNELLALTPSKFELAVADLLRDLGYSHVQRIGRSGDLGADISCRDKKRRSVVVQCKRYAPGARVGSRDMQGFIGMVKVHHQADSGIFVTTSEFTKPAADLAQQHGVMLIDGPRLSQLIDKVAHGQARAPLTPPEADGVRVSSDKP
jgi:restriction system protein